MANELQTDFLANKTVYYLLRNATGSIWNGATFTAYVTVNFATYPITATEQGTASGFYTGTMPAVAAGVYAIVAKQQVGGSPAESDISVGWGMIQWDGTAVLPLSGVPTTTNAAALAATILETDITGTIEGAAPVHSLAVAILKLVSKFDGLTGRTFKTDGTTVKMTQTPTTNPAMVPIQSLGVGA